MLGLGIGGQARGIGREKGERRIHVFTILGQIEVHAADQVPRRIAALEEVLNPAVRFCQFDAEGGVQFVPEGAQNLRGEILRASHGRRGEDEPVQLGGGRRRDAHFTRCRAGIRVGTEGGHVGCAEFSPIGENRRQRGSGFGRSELKKTVTRSALEGSPQALRQLELERRRVRILDHREAAVRR